MRAQLAFEDHATRSAFGIGTSQHKVNESANLVRHVKDVGREFNSPLLRDLEDETVLTAKSQLGERLPVDAAGFGHRSPFERNRNAKGVNDATGLLLSLPKEGRIR